MTLSKIVVIYSKSQNTRQRLIVSDSDDRDYDVHTQNLHPDEGVWEMPIEQYNLCVALDNHAAGISIDDALAEHLGVSLPAGRIKDITFYPDTLTTFVPHGMFNTEWQIILTGDIFVIGCETHSIEEWKNFTAAEVGVMSAPNIQTAKWWQSNRNDLMALAMTHQNNCAAIKAARVGP